MNREAAMQLIEGVAPFMEFSVTLADRNKLAALRQLANKAGAVDGLPVTFEEAKGNSLQARYGEAVDKLCSLERELWALANPRADLPKDPTKFKPVGPEPIKEKI